MAQASAIESASREVFCEFVCTGELHIVHDCHGERYERRALRPTEKDTIANFVADQFSADQFSNPFFVAHHPTKSCSKPCLRKLSQRRRLWPLTHSSIALASSWN